MAILTISREYGSGGRELGYAISDLLKYDYIDKERIFRDIKEAGNKWAEWSAAIDEHTPSVWERYDWSFQGWGALLQFHILNHCLDNNVVITGRGGNFLLAGVPYALRIRVKAPIGMKIERIMRRDSLDEKTARWLSEKTDRERAGFIHAVYGKEIEDPKGYDMVIDLGRHTMEEVIKTIESRLKELDAQFTEKARHALEMKTLAAKIKSKILTDPSFLLPLFDAYYEGGQIVLTGVIHSAEEHKRIEDSARAVAGNVPVKCSLHYRM